MIAFDTHRYVKELTEAGVPEKQAEVNVRMFSDILEDREQLYIEKLASKQDLFQVKSELKQEISDVKVSLAKINGEFLWIKWMLGVIVAGIVALVIKSFFV